MFDDNLFHFITTTNIVANIVTQRSISRATSNNADLILIDETLPKSGNSNISFIIFAVQVGSKIHDILTQSIALEAAVSRLTLGWFDAVLVV